MLSKPLGRKTLMHPYCWVCGVRFKTSTPPGPANREDHHVFPRNAGGTDGPLVSLCDTDHSTLHKIAHRMHGPKPFVDLLVGRDTIAQRKLVWLAAMVCKAEQSVEGDPNKLLISTVKLTQTEALMLRKLLSVLPNAKGQADVFKIALYNLYKAHFK